MIKLLNILQEIIVGPRDALAQKRIQEYIKNGSQGDLDLSGTPIQYLPKGFKVRGDLDLSNCKNLKSLPKGFKVRGDLFLSNTQIQSLPNDFKVGGDLFLDNTPIQSLPNGLKVEGHLGLSNTPIQSLPNGLEVGGSLWLNNTRLSKEYTTVEELKAEYPDLKVEINIYLENFEHEEEDFDPEGDNW